MHPDDGAEGPVRDTHCDEEGRLHGIVGRTG